MIGFNPHTRRPGLPVPIRRDMRVAPASTAGDAGSEKRQRALVAVKTPSTPRAANDRPPTKPANDVARSCARAGLSLQTDAPAPRRGLRADAVERQRYRNAYEAAGRAAPRVIPPQMVRSA